MTVDHFYGILATPGAQSTNDYMQPTHSQSVLLHGYDYSRTVMQRIMHTENGYACTQN